MYVRSRSKGSDMLFDQGFVWACSLDIYCEAKIEHNLWHLFVVQWDKSSTVLWPHNPTVVRVVVNVGREIHHHLYSPCHIKVTKAKLNHWIYIYLSIWFLRISFRLKLTPRFLQRWIMEGQRAKTEIWYSVGHRGSSNQIKTKTKSTSSGVKALSWSTWPRSITL